MTQTRRHGRLTNLTRFVALPTLAVTSTLMLALTPVEAAPNRPVSSQCAALQEQVATLQKAVAYHRHQAQKYAQLAAQTESEIATAKRASHAETMRTHLLREREYQRQAEAKAQRYEAQLNQATSTLRTQCPGVAVPNLLAPSGNTTTVRPGVPLQPGAAPARQTAPAPSTSRPGPTRHSPKPTWDGLPITYR